MILMGNLKGIEKLVLFTEKHKKKKKELCFGSLLQRKAAKESSFTSKTR